MVQDGRKKRKHESIYAQEAYESGVSVEGMDIRLQLWNETNMTTPSAFPSIKIGY
jgi:hypothetical protein